MGRSMASLLMGDRATIDVVRDQAGAVFKEGMMTRMVAASKGSKLETSRRPSPDPNHALCRNGATRSHVT